MKETEEEKELRMILTKAVRRALNRMLQGRRATKATKKAEPCEHPYAKLQIGPRIDGYSTFVCACGKWRKVTLGAKEWYDDIDDYKSHTIKTP